MRVVAAALLFGFGVTFGVLHDAIAASLSLTPNQNDSFLRTLELRDASNEFYYHEGHQCKRCPPGTHVSVHCKSSGSAGTCLPCPDETYVQHMNPYETCSNCKTCRSLDEVELKPCTRTSNTQCACRNGSFCLPSLPCETCRKCTIRCPDGEVMVRPCTPESDIQCEKSSSTPAAGSNGHSVWIILGVILTLVLLILGVCVCLKRGRARGTESSRANICSSRTILRLKRKFNLQQSEERDNSQNEQVDPESRCFSNNPDDACVMVPLQAPERSGLPAYSEENPVTERLLVPQNGRDPMDALRQSFQTFIDLVPVKEWKRFMRALGLTENEIDIAEADEKCVNDQYFLMLRTWLAKEGREATVDTLLEKLCAIELRGIMRHVKGRLVSQGLYCYEE